MILAKDIYRNVRIKTKDNNAMQFSDYDIKNAMNEALRYIGQSQAMQNSDYLLKEKTYNEYDLNKEVQEWNETHEEQKPLYDFKLEGVELPEDYQIIHSVTRLNDTYTLKPCDAGKKPHFNEYKVMGEKIYSGSKFFKLTYKRVLKTVKNVKEDEIDLPTFCLDIIVKITVLILNQAETDVMLQVIGDLTRAIIPKRRYRNVQTKMPFYC